MSDRGFDVLVTAFAPRHETAGSALARIVGIAAAEADALCRDLPCVVLRDVAYGRAESIVASLQLAGAEARVRAHVRELPAADEHARLTMPEIGARTPGLGAARDDSVRPPAPTTLRPPDVSDAEPAAVFEPPRAWGAPELELDPRPRATAAQPQAFAAEFGEGLALELELAAMPRSARQLELDRQAEPGEPLERAESGRVSLDFRLSFPRVPAVAPAPSQPERARPAAHGGASSAAPAAAPRARAPRPLLEPNGTITRRMLLLLALLWASVGLLLWTHGLL